MWSIAFVAASLVRQSSDYWFFLCSTVRANWINAPCECDTWCQLGLPYLPPTERSIVIGRTQLCGEKKTEKKVQNKKYTNLTVIPGYVFKNPFIIALWLSKSPWVNISFAPSFVFPFSLASRVWSSAISLTLFPPLWARSTLTDKSSLMLILSLLANPGIPNT